MDAISRLPFIKESKLFEGIDDEGLYSIAERLSELEMFKGELIFSEGENNHSMFLICSGKVQITQGNITLRTLSTYDSFGELGLFNAYERLAQAKCLEEGLLFEIDGTEFEQIIMQFPHCLYKFACISLDYLTANPKFNKGGGHGEWKCS